MATLKIILRKDKGNSLDNFPLYIRINEGERKKMIAIGVRIKEEEWDEEEQKVKRAHKNHVALNAIINKAKIEAEEKILDIITKDKKQPIIHTIIENEKKVYYQNFFLFADLYLKELEVQNKINRLITERARIDLLKKYVGTDTLLFDEIDVNFLKKFRLHLKSVRSISERTIMNYYIVIRTIYNRAIEEGVADRNKYPFGKNKIVIKFPESLKLGLNQEEVHLIEQLDVSDKPHLQMSKNIWLFSFYLAGMRISDILKLKWKDCIDGRLNYIMGKNQKVVSLKIPQKACEILNTLRHRKQLPKDLVFPHLKLVDLSDAKATYIAINTTTGRINRHLKTIAEMCGIDKPLSCHISRHTFGNITGDKISPQMLQKLYRHSDIKTTMGYQANFIHNDVDEALEKVLDF